MSGTAVVLVLAFVAFVVAFGLALSQRAHVAAAVSTGLALWVAAQLFGALSP